MQKGLALRGQSGAPKDLTWPREGQFDLPAIFAA
jgi:hypothetical protein